MAETATIVMTDLVGSTEIGVRLGDDRADVFRRRHDAELTEISRAHGGTVIKGLGDGLLVTFSGASEALGASVAMQQALRAMGRRESLELAMRVGVAAGDVTFDEGDCFGTPVVEASRLCDAAAAGQILLTDLVRLLARHRGDLDLAPGGPLALKGLPEQMEVWSLAWRPPDGFTELTVATPFVGRTRELKSLEQVWRQAAAGSGGLVLVAGEPGIGKSRFVKEVADHVVRPEGGLVLSGGCHDGDVVASAPFAGAISAWVRSVEPERAAVVLGGCAPVVARLAPAVREVLPETPEPFPVAPDAELLRLRDSVPQFFLRLAARAPVMLVLEDLHWADDATVGLLRAVARESRGGPLLVVGTYRETDLDRRHPFAAAVGTLQREVEPVRVALSGLARAEVRSMLEQLAGHEVPEAFASLLAGETEGNPFFLRETLLHLLEEGRIRRDGDMWTTGASTAELGIPAGVREVIGRRLSRLSDEANQLLLVAALFEVTFPLPIVAEVAGLTEQAALDALDEALEAQIVTAADTFDHYGFTHALFRHTLVEELNPSRQVRLHRAIADAIERGLGDRSPTPEQAAVLLRHLHLSAALPGAERAVPYALQLADDAASRYSRREELDAVLMALDCVDDADKRAADLWRRAARTALFAGLPPETIVAHATRAAELLAAGVGADAAADFVAELVWQTETVTGIQMCWDLGDLTRRWLPDRPDLAFALTPVDPDALRAQVREKYRAVAVTPEDTFHFHTGRPLATYLGYEHEDFEPLPVRAVESFAGVGNPFSLRRLQRGERILDVGSGAGFDSFVAAAQVGPQGRVIGIDMTPEMVDKATATAAQLPLDNVEFLAGYAEALPIEDGWADVVVSNGVINLCADKKAVFAELHRVLRPGGWLQFADIANGRPVPPEALRDIDLWCA